MNKNLMDNEISIEFEDAVKTINAVKTMLLSSHEYKSWLNMMVPKGSEDTIYFYPITLDIELINTTIEQSFLQWKRKDVVSIFDAAKTQMDKIMRNQLPFIVSEKEPDTNPDSEFFKTYCDNQSIDQLYGILSIIDKTHNMIKMLYEKNPSKIITLLTGKPDYLDRMRYVLLTFIQKKARERDLKFFSSKWRGYVYAISKYTDSEESNTALMPLLGIIPYYKVISRAAKNDIKNTLKHIVPPAVDISAAPIDLVNKLNNIYNDLINYNNYIWID